jgi:hypothetical protein
VNAVLTKFTRKSERRTKRRGRWKCPGVD